MARKQLAIFASGNGSNAVKIIDHFRKLSAFDISLLVTNRENAGVLAKTSNEDLKQIIITNDQANDGNFLSDLMKSNQIDYIILSGYLRMIPKALIQAYPHHIINIHPALLPKFGGHGMYGIHVHKAVKEAEEEESGITIHLVNEEYDKGEIIAQHKVLLNSTDKVEDIQRKVQRLEHDYFASEIENFINRENG